jgi:hypothetical protein
MSQVSKLSRSYLAGALVLMILPTAGCSWLRVPDESVWDSVPLLKGNASKSSEAKDDAIRKSAEKDDFPSNGRPLVSDKVR